MRLRVGRNPIFRGGLFAVQRGYINPAMTFTRASRGMSRLQDGVTYLEYNNDTPRYNGTDRRLLMEGQRTNGVRNPRFEGATLGVLGTGGVMPTYMSVALGTGNSLEVAAVGTEIGLSSLDLIFTGIDTASMTISLEDASGIALTASQLHTASLGASLVSGAVAAFTSFSLRMRVDAATPVNFAGTDMRGVGATVTRYSTTVTPAADATAGRSQIIVRGNGTARFRLTMPQVEVGAFASTPMLPVVGTPAASTRAIDLFSGTLASINATNARALYWTGVIPQNAPTGRDQILAQLDNGTDAARMYLVNAAGGATINAICVVGGVAVATLALGSMTAGTSFTTAFAWTASAFTGMMTGNALQSASVTPPTVTTIRVANNATDGNSAGFHETDTLQLSLSATITGV